MTYIRTSNRPADKRAKAAVIVCAAIVVIIAGVQMLSPHFLPGLFNSVARPFWRTGFSMESGSMDSPGSLLAQNESLKLQLAALNAQRQSEQATMDENSELLSLLGRSDAVSTSTAQGASSTALSYMKPISGRILAAVLIRPPAIDYDELIIDVGADRGIALGAKIYAPGGVLIGTTTDVFSQTSKVELFSSPGETYPVLIGSGLIPATAVGRGGGQYEAEVPQAAKVDQGDTVSDSSISDAPFGIVASVLANAADPFETVIFAPPVNIYQLRWVLVATSTNR